MVTQATNQPKAAARASGSLLSAVKRGVQKRPLRMVLYGVEGIGKTLFASNAPSPIFLGSEDGFGTIDAARFPAPQSWSDVRAAVNELATQPHEFKTLVIDTADWIEPMLFTEICARAGKSSIKAFNFGDGYTIAVDEGWRPLLAQLEELGRKGMHIIVLAHAKAENHQPPDGEAFERWTLKIDKRAGGLLKEWCDTLLFANWGGAIVDKSGKKARAIGERYRALHTESSSGAFEAKNRYHLAPVLNLDWPEFYDGYERAFDRPRLQREFDEIAAKVPEAVAAKARAWVSADPNGTSRLLRSIDRLRALTNNDSKE